jgi:hypothetical protein
MNAAEPLRSCAARLVDENDPTLVRVTEALRKLKRGEITAQVADATLDSLVEAWTKKIREGPPRGVVVSESGFRTAPFREWARRAGIDENDPLLLRALKAQSKADWKTNWISCLEIDVAALAFIEGHFEIKDAWPPHTDRVEALLQRMAKGEATPTDVEEFRRTASEVLRNWEPQYSPAFKQRIESAMGALDGLITWDYCCYCAEGYSIQGREVKT